MVIMSLIFLLNDDAHLKDELDGGIKIARKQVEYFMKTNEQEMEESSKNRIRVALKRLSTIYWLIIYLN
jgi:hypothetical protein